jgi:hypothetical protein
MFEFVRSILPNGSYPILYMHDQWSYARLLCFLPAYELKNGIYSLAVGSNIYSMYTPLKTIAGSFFNELWNDKFFNACI